MDFDVRDRLERRVLVLTPTGRDGPLTCSILQDLAIGCEVCTDTGELARELEAGAGTLLVAEEAIDEDAIGPLAHALSRQLPWSDVPVIVLTHPGVDSAAARQAVDSLGNVTLLERPVRMAALISTVRTALRARQRQYQIRAHLFERERAAEALRDADRRKDEFVAVLAHELRNPLAPIRNALHILRLTSKKDEAAERVREMMERQVNHMVRLVDDLLEVSRITSGKIELRREVVPLVAVVRNAVETSQPLIDAFRHQLTISLPPEPLSLEGDPVRLAQILSNLLNNAAKYSEAAGRIWLTVKRAGDMVVLSVRDTGLGISKETLPHVFNLFNQGDGAAGRTQSGLGIGLTLVKSLAEMHGGDVEARSEGLGRGSEFIVRLPLAKAKSESELPSYGMPSVTALPPRRVVVVDDNHDAADSLALLLRLLGAEVRVAYDGASGMEAVREFRPSIVLLDIGMRGIDGYEVARRIRGDAELSAVTLVALTGWGQEEDRRRSREAGFDHHLIKPADGKALETLLTSLEGGGDPTIH